MHGAANLRRRDPPGSPAPAWVFSAVDLARVEAWSFFEPRPPGGDPDYTFLGNRLRLEAQGRWPKAEVTFAAQHVGFLGLPAQASGPGPLGTGALYFDQGGRRTSPQQLYLRDLNVRLPNMRPCVDLQIGRMAYASGAEAPSGVPKIESVKRQRLDSRLVGEFEWPLYQRGYGVRLDLTRPRWKTTGVVLMPTQGGFARVAGLTMTDMPDLEGGVQVTNEESGSISVIDSVARAVVGTIPQRLEGSDQSTASGVR
nr:hypothetical protein [Acidobacteriota bacterium]